MRLVLVLSPLLIGLFTCCSGCSETVPVGYVKGKVEYQGKPVPVSTKIFFEQQGTGYIAAGSVKDDGSYTLNRKRAAEIQPGEYLVFIGAPNSNMSEAEYRAYEAKVNAEYRSRGQKPPPVPDWVLPEKYYLPSTTPFRKTVQAGENVIDLVLED